MLSRIQLRPTVLYYIHNWCQTDATTGLRGHRHALGRLLPESPNYSSWRGNPIWPRMGVATAESKSGIKCEGMQIIWNGCLKSNWFLKCCSWSEITPKFRRARRAVCASVHTKLTFCKTLTALKLLGKKSMCYSPEMLPCNCQTNHIHTEYTVGKFKRIWFWAIFHVVKNIWKYSYFSRNKCKCVSMAIGHLPSLETQYLY